MSAGRGPFIKFSTHKKFAAQITPQGYGRRIIIKQNFINFFLKSLKIEPRARAIISIFTPGHQRVKLLLSRKRNWVPFGRADCDHIMKNRRPK